ncbi:MAG: DUF4115 domain-containing protein [Synergistota bacterium]|nr:DUF4115 domain-containing protein [Synergistota bacterium]
MNRDEENTIVQRTAPELGGEIRKRREKKCLSVNDISEITRIRASFIEALERGDIEALPGSIYRMGFIRTILSRVDGLDLLPEYEKICPRDADEDGPVSVEYMPPQKGFQKVSRMWVYGFIVFAVVLSLTLIWQQRDALREKMTSSPSAETAQPAQNKTVVSADVAQSEPVKETGPGAETLAAETGVSEDVAAAPADDGAEADMSWIPGREAASGDATAEHAKNVLVIKARGNCWTRVTVGEKVVFQDTLRPGDVKTFNVSSKTYVRYGNGSAAMVEWNGLKARRAGGPGEVVTYAYMPDGTSDRLPEPAQ